MCALIESTEPVSALMENCRKFLVVFCTLLCLVCVNTVEATTRSFRERLAHRLPDIERVDLVVSEFDKLCDETNLDETTALAIENWLCSKCIFIGSKYYDHDLLYKSLPTLKDNKRFVSKFRSFAKAITLDNSASWKKDPYKTTKKITLLFTGAYGGGHRAPAMALSKYLEQKGHTIQIIDVDEVENRYSPQINGYTKADIYAEVYQKQNDPKKAKKLTRLLNQAQDVEDKRFLSDINNALCEFQPDHIIAVAHHKPKLSYLSYNLGVPMTFIHTDHGFNRMLLSVLYEQEGIENPLIHFALLGDDPLFKTSDSIVKQLVRVDFPVRESFKPTSSKQKNLLRQMLKIPRNASVVKLAMGQNGLATDMKKIIKRIKKDAKKVKKPLYVFAVCGKNVALKTELKKYASSKGKVHIRILGFLEEAQMAAIDRASDLWITKPGGSTSAELVQTRKQMLYEIHPAHPWEQNNANYLESMGLAKKLKRNKSIVKQINARIKHHKTLAVKQLPKTQWKAQIDSIIE